MMIKDYKYIVDKWYVSTDEHYIQGKLDAGLTLSTKRELIWFDTEESYENYLASIQ